MNHKRTIAVIGLGYVGLPLAVSFAKAGFSVTGFDVSRGRVEELRHYRDRTREVASDVLADCGLRVTHELSDIRSADFFIITVPTPIDDSACPDLSMLLAASRTVGRALKRGDVVVYESTVYPGATEEECIPILEATSGMKAGSDFAVGFSPERINPGDEEHRFEDITKVVSGQDARTLDIVAETYGAVVKAGIYRAPSIKVAEAAKVIENTQRDLNIALMNELSLICSRMGIDTGDVLAAAGTKWNFLRFTPGLVGGHCVGVDPFYLTHQARRLGYHAEVVLAGRRVNDGMGRHIARECIRRLGKLGRPNPLVSVLGITFKENVPDIRNSKSIDVVDELRSYGVAIQISDPLAHPDEVEHEYGEILRPLEALDPADAVVIAVAHRMFVTGGWSLIHPLLRDGRGIVLDVKGILDRGGASDAIELWRM